jgi:hypothetical protein
MKEEFKYEIVKQLYKSKLNEGKFDEIVKGIGLIEIVRKSKTKSYSISKKSMTKIQKFH